MNGATQAGVVASARAALPIPTADAILFADVTQLAYTPHASLPAGEQSPGTLGRVSQIENQRGPGPAFTQISAANRPYVYGTIGGSAGVPYKWGVRAGSVGSTTSQGPQRLCPSPSAWSASFTLFARVELIVASTTSAFDVRKNATDHLRMRISSGTQLFHSRAANGFSAYSAASSNFAFAVATWRSLSFSFDSSTRNTHFYADGVFLSTVGSGGTADPAMDGASTETLSTFDITAPNFFHSFFAAYSRVLTATEHAQLHAYALTLPMP